ncbi:MAG: CopG family transcriptional regulator [Clostridia bacterium]|nr:CopG family transcriptional regulator [Clostridia bacterium]
MEEKRVGVIGIVVEDPQKVQDKLNNYISQASDIVIGRLGIPYRARNVAVLAILVDGTNDAINTLTGLLGSLPGVKVRAALTKA